MALALEERSTTELLGQNDAIKALKKENELLETEKDKLSEKVCASQGYGGASAGYRLGLFSHTGGVWWKYSALPVEPSAFNLLS
jgi:hypothetical protein